MPDIPRDVAEHSLDIRAGARPVKQTLRHFDKEKCRAIGEEIHKLLAAGFIKKVFHPEWLANHVLVRKKDGKWRMCVDYTGLNKACPKVPYPLPRIDQIVDSTAGCETLLFLDAYSGYHQIKMKESDQLATSFITPFGMYCYTTMPFGLRNAGATYQRCMNHVFGEHIGRTVKTYVDDIVVKTKKASNLLSDLETTFKCLRAKGVKLNPEKCVFGVPRGMLLRFIVSQRGIEANPDKIAAITNMGPIKDLKGVQRVMGCLAALSRFISRLGEKGLPLYRLLRKTERFTWTPEAEEALGNLKELLTNAPILVPPAVGEALLIYVAATTQVVSATVVVKRREGHTLLIQRPVYFISEVLFETKVYYLQIQKLLYTVILTRRKLRHYFESHPVTVVSSFPLGEIIQSREASGRIEKWVVELMGETLSFQVLADFLVEWTDTQLPTTPIQLELWTMYFDGSLMKTGAGASLLLISPLGKHLRYVIRLHFPASNNVAEYKALVNGLRIAVELGVRCLDARGDSQLVIDQVMKNSHCYDRKVEAYCDEVRRLEDKFYGLELNHVARRFNETADELAKIASGRTPVPPDVFSRDIHQSSVKTDDTPEIPSAKPEEASAGPEVPSATEGEALRIEGERNGAIPVPNWQTPYLEYLLQGELPLDKAKARRLARRARSFVLLGDERELYHRSPSGILQRCISITQGQELLQEIHSGACGHHAAPRALVGNAFQQGFYWPTAVADATRIVRSCRGCQFYAKQTRLPAQALQMIPITWPFAVWGLDLVGPLQKAPGGFTHLLVAIDKFSKWIEVRPLTSIRSEQAVAFFTNIIHRFGVPNSIITDNGTQFTGKKFLDFCEDHHIRVDWATVAHPMTNGQVERANGMILQGLKPRIHNDLNKFGKRCTKELPSVVWSLRTTPSRATDFTPFFLVYGAEAILPTDLEYGSPRTKAYDDRGNQISREDSLDQLEEARDIALLHSARYQQSLRRYHARRVRPRGFQVGDLVLRL
jgi:ribonuclease HI/transposase InsO family protein